MSTSGTGRARAALLAAPVAALLVGAGLSVPAPAAAAVPAGTTAVSGPRQSVTLVLTPRDRRGLRALAAHGGRRSARDLQAVLPGAQRAADVRRQATGLGLTVTGSTPLTVTVTGRARLVRTLFGSARSRPSRDRQAAALPALPAALRGAVTVAFGGDETRPAFHRLATVDQLRAAYGVTGAGAPPAGRGTQTVATVQLSDWDPGDLDAFAGTLPAGTPRPVLTQVRDPDDPPVRARTATEPGFGDDVEVALDQEAVFAAAPWARQRAYLSGNSLQGTYDSFVHLAEDASRTDAAGDQHLTAVSYSWGVCEADLVGEPGFVDAFEDVFSYILSSGVTIFAASGDSGSSCTGSDADGNPLDEANTLSYPASSPQVVAVGGTSFTADDGSSQQGWAVATDRAPFAGASGGGESRLFPRPAYQDGVVTSSRRVVPDIAALAGSPGFPVLTSSPAVPADRRRPHSVAVWGTSLAAPLSAALFTGALRAQGYSWGIGSVHTGLYAARGGPGLVDVTEGASNGFDTPRPGYDGVTGLGTPRWETLLPLLGGDPHLSTPRYAVRTATVPVTVQRPAWQRFTSYRVADTGGATPSCSFAGAGDTPPGSVDLRDAAGRLTQGVHELALLAVDPAGGCHVARASVLVDTVAPSSAPLLRLAAPTTPTVVASWSLGDAAPSSGGLRADVTVRDISTGQVVRTLQATTATSLSFPGAGGHSYLLAVSGTDAAGNRGRTGSAAPLTVPLDGAAFAGFTRATGTSRDFAGTISLSSTRGATASRAVRGRAYTLLLRTGPSYGIAEVRVDGRRTRLVDTYRAVPGYRVPVDVGVVGAAAPRTVSVVVTGTRNRASRGTTVALDALVPVL